MYRSDGWKCQSENRSVRTEKKCISDSRIQSAAASGTAKNVDKVTEEELLDSIEESRKNMMLVRVEVTDSGTEKEEEEFLA